MDIARPENSHWGGHGVKLLTQEKAHMDEPHTGWQCSILYDYIMGIVRESVAAFGLKSKVCISGHEQVSLKTKIQ